MSCGYANEPSERRVTAPALSVVDEYRAPMALARGARRRRLISSVLRLEQRVGALRWAAALSRCALTRAISASSSSMRCIKLVLRIGVEALAGQQARGIAARPGDDRRPLQCSIIRGAACCQRAARLAHRGAWQLGNRERTNGRETSRNDDRDRFDAPGGPEVLGPRQLSGARAGPGRCWSRSPSPGSTGPM